MGEMQGNPWCHDLTVYRNAGNDHSPTVKATLALAYEQRTANLIAWFGGGGSFDQAHVELQQQIVQRLGLNDV